MLLQAITVVLGSCEAAFGIWVMIAAPSHNLGLFMLLLGSSNAAVGLFVAFWYTQVSEKPPDKLSTGSPDKTIN